MNVLLARNLGTHLLLSVLRGFSLCLLRATTVRDLRAGGRGAWRRRVALPPPALRIRFGMFADMQAKLPGALQ